MLGSKYVNTLVKGKPLHYKPQFMMRVLSIIVFYINNPGWNAHDVQDHCRIEKLPFWKNGSLKQCANCHLISVDIVSINVTVNVIYRADTMPCETPSNHHFVTGLSLLCLKQIRPSSIGSRMKILFYCNFLQRASAFSDKHFRLFTSLLTVFSFLKLIFSFHHEVNETAKLVCLHFHLILIQCRVNCLFC